MIVILYAGYDMQFDIKYAYFNFLQSIRYRSTPSTMINDKLSEEIDSDSAYYESWWIFISSLSRPYLMNSSECWIPNVQGYLIKHFQECEKALFPKRAATCSSIHLYHVMPIFPVTIFFLPLSAVGAVCIGLIEQILVLI